MLSHCDNNNDVVIEKFFNDIVVREQVTAGIKTCFNEIVKHILSITNGNISDEMKLKIKTCFAMFLLHDISFYNATFSCEEGRLFFRMVTANNVFPKEVLDENGYDLMRASDWIQEMYIRKLMRCKTIQDANKIRDIEREKLDALYVADYDYDHRWGCIGQKRKPLRRKYIDHFTLDFASNTKYVKVCTFGHITLTCNCNCKPKMCKCGRKFT